MFSCQQESLLETQEEKVTQIDNDQLLEVTQQKTPTPKPVVTPQGVPTPKPTTAIAASLRPVKRPAKKSYPNRNFPLSFDKLFITISPGQTISGPVLDTKTDSFDTYADTIVQMALKEAHEVAKEYLQTKEYKKYYTMMLMSLVVPTHESMNLHFRKVTNKQDRCSDRRNNGQTLIDQDITKNNFLRAFRESSNPFLVDCQKLNPNQKIFQLIAGGSDGSDIGIMQVSSKWHYEDYLQAKKYQSVRSSLRYGINFLHTGFKQIARNASKYPCILTSSKDIDYHKLARASWGGWYNGGQVKKACRFANPSSKHASKDKLFLENLKRTIEAGNGKPFGSVIATQASNMLTFSISSHVKRTIQEISKNIENGTNVQTHLNSLIR